MQVEVVLVVVSPCQYGRDTRFLLIERDGGQLALPTAELSEQRRVGAVAKDILDSLFEDFKVPFVLRTREIFDDTDRLVDGERHLGVAVRYEVSSEHVKLKDSRARWVNFQELVEAQPLFMDHMHILQVCSTRPLS